MTGLILTAAVALAAVAGWIGCRVGRHLAAIDRLTGEADMAAMRRHTDDMARLGQATR